MPFYLIEYHGTIQIQADSAEEAEMSAAFDCSPDNCRVVDEVDEEIES